MYVRVLKKSNKWFREDNGTLVGTEISKTSGIYRKIGKNQTIVKNSKHEFKAISYGHFVNNKFIRLPFPNSIALKDSTCGFYTFVLD